MIPQPTLGTGRLILRPFRNDDAPAVSLLAGDAEVASTTASIPHPYPRGMAEAWIATHLAKLQQNIESIYAVTLRTGGTLVGAAGFTLDADGRDAELGYWIGKPFWRQGYASEAVLAMIGYGFDTLGLDTVRAHHMARNPASGRVLEKAGLRFTGEGARRMLNSGAVETVRSYALTRDEFLGRGRAPAAGRNPGPEAAP